MGYLRTRRARVACVLLAAAVLLPACGGGDEEQAETVVVGEGSEPTSTLPPPARGEVDEGEEPGGGPPPGKGGDGEPERVPDPPPEGPVELTRAGLTDLFETVLGERTKDGGPRVRSASCSESRCRVVYVTDIPGPGKILSDQRGIWEKLFSARELEAATLVAVSGPKDTPDGGTEIPDALSITCTRRRTEGVPWSRIEAAGIASVCRVGERK